MDNFFRSTLGTPGWIIMALIPPAIFALYFLKLRRQPVEVPSTYLWHRVIEDLHVNSLWQRLRKSLLLFLQLLVVALAILALLRPGWQGQSLQGQRFIFLVDNSASMSATDAPANASRLQLAKQRVDELVDQLESDMSAMIVSFAEEPVVVQEFTDNKRSLKEALTRIQPTNSVTELADALELADGFANPEKITLGETEYEVTEQQEVDLFILSDGRFGSVENFSLGNLRPQFLPLGSIDASNLAITNFNVRRGEERPELQQAFVQVANFSELAQRVVVELYQSGRLLDAAELEIEADGIGASTFMLDDQVAGELRARISFPAEYEDQLPLDNEAYTVVETKRDANVLLITPGNTTVETVLSTARAQRLANVTKLSSDLLEEQETQAQLQTEFYDLVIFDQCSPQQMPRANTLFIGRLPPGENWSPQDSAEPVYAPQIIDWDRSHPLLNLVELGSVRIADSLLAKPPLGGRVLIDSTEGPLLAIAPRDRFEDVVMGFEIIGSEGDGAVTFNTDWPRKHSFPNFWMNVLEYMTVGSRGELASYQPNDLVELKIPANATTVDVQLPDGTVQEVPPQQPGRLAFHQTEQLGVYEVWSGGEIVKRFAVNLFDREECDIALRTQQTGQDGLQTVESLSIGYVDVAAQMPGSTVRKELWRWLLLGALVVLLVEWYIYNRRVYI